MKRDSGRHAERGDAKQAPSAGCQSGPEASPKRYRDTPTEAEIDAGIEEILAKDDTEIMLDELRELFGADLDVDSRFTIAQVITAMERSFEQGKAHIQMVNRAMQAARSEIPVQDEPTLTADEEAELVERINANPNLQPVQDDDAKLVERLREEAEAFGGSRFEDDEGNVLAALFNRAADRIERLRNQSLDR